MSLIAHINLTGQTGNSPVCLRPAPEAWISAILKDCGLTLLIQCFSSEVKEWILVIQHMHFVQLSYGPWLLFFTRDLGMIYIDCPLFRSRILSPIDRMEVSLASSKYTFATDSTLNRCSFCVRNGVKLQVSQFARQTVLSMISRCACLTDEWTETAWAHRGSYITRSPY